jgi:F-type H+-transporting ATPase subunit epsilon
MRTITVSLLDGLHEQRLEGIASLVAVDDSGQFGILPGHETLVTALAAGLIRCRLADGSTRHLACTGGVLLCRHDHVRIVSARFLIGDRAEELTEQLDELLEREDAERAASRQSRTQVDRALMKRLREWSQAERA